MIVFERAGLVFAFNFHWDKSFTDYRIACETPGKYQPVLSSDDKDFGGMLSLHSRPSIWTDRSCS